MYIVPGPGHPDRVTIAIPFVAKEQVFEICPVWTWAGLKFNGEADPNQIISGKVYALSNPDPTVHLSFSKSCCVARCNGRLRCFRREESCEGTNKAGLVLNSCLLPNYVSISDEKLIASNNIEDNALSIGSGRI